MKQTAARNRSLASLESQRAAAELGSRPDLDARNRALALYTAMLIAKRDNRMADAREYAKSLKPLLWALPEGE